MSFELKDYSRKELAVLYFPRTSARGAYLSLWKWLGEKKEKDPELLKEIHGKKNFPKPIVKRIVELLGEP
jgi:hypothetical protein